MSLVWSDPSGTQYHEAEALRTPAGQLVQVDAAMVPLVQALWYADFVTFTCCQDIGETLVLLNPRLAAYRQGQAMLELPVTDAQRLAGLAAKHGFPMGWKDDGAWEMLVPLSMFPALAQVYFPAGQLAAVTDMARAEALRVRAG